MDASRIGVRLHGLNLSSRLDSPSPSPTQLTGILSLTNKSRRARRKIPVLEIHRSMAFSHPFQLVSPVAAIFSSVSVSGTDRLLSTLVLSLSF